MKLKASVDYGVRAILYLAIKGDTCSSREISEEMAVPRDYLIQLALRLRNAGLPASDINTGDILDAFDSDLKHVRVPMKSSRSASDSANTVRFLHGAVVESLESYLNAISLQDLVGISENNEDSSELIARALEGEVKRLRAK